MEANPLCYASACMPSRNSAYHSTFARFGQHINNITLGGPDVFYARAAKCSSLLRWPPIVKKEISDPFCPSVAPKDEGPSLSRRHSLFGPPETSTAVELKWKKTNRRQESSRVLLLESWRSCSSMTRQNFQRQRPSLLNKRNERLEYRSIQP